jgi:hypothetical protein
MTPRNGLDRHGPVEPELRDELASYVERHPRLREGFILVARQNVDGDLVVITVGDFAAHGPER